MSAVATKKKAASKPAKKAPAKEKAAPKKTAKKPAKAASKKETKAASVTDKKDGELTIQEYAKQEGVSKDAVILWIKTGKLPARHAVKEGNQRGPWYIKATQKRPPGFAKTK